MKCEQSPERRGFGCYSGGAGWVRGKNRPHVAANDGRPSGSALNRRTLRHAGYVISQQKRKRVEEIFGWIKTIANFRRTRYRGLELTQMAAYLVAAAYNLMRTSHS